MASYFYSVCCLCFCSIYSYKKRNKYIYLIINISVQILLKLELDVVVCPLYPPTSFDQIIFNQAYEQTLQSIQCVNQLFMHISRVLQIGKVERWLNKLIWCFSIFLGLTGRGNFGINLKIPLIKVNSLIGLLTKITNILN